MKRSILVVSLATALLLSPAALWAQTQNQMIELMQQLTRLEKEMRQLRGEVERLSYENKRLKSQQNDFYMDLDQRLGKIEKTGQSGNLAINSPAATSGSLIASSTTNHSAPAGSLQSVEVTNAQTPPVAGAQSGSPLAAVSSGSRTAVTPQAIIDPAKEQEDYKKAFNLLKSGKYEEAVTAYNDFLSKYPNGQYASNAQYWLGEANYVTRQFPQALNEFNKVVINFPDSRKLPDAMLKIGYIHYELKDAGMARRVLTDLKQQFPGTTASRLAENRLQRMKLEGK